MKKMSTVAVKLNRNISEQKLTIDLAPQSHRGCERLYPTFLHVTN